MANFPPPEDEEIVIGGNNSDSGIEGSPADELQGMHQPEGDNFDEVEFPANDVEVDNPLSAVASAPAKNILIMAVLGVAALVFLYNFIFTETPEEIARNEQQEQAESQPVEAAMAPTRQNEKPQVNIGVVETPELPLMENQPLPLPYIDEPKEDYEPLAPQQPEEEMLQIPTPSPPSPPPAPVTPGSEKVVEPVVEPVFEPQPSIEAQQIVEPAPLTDEEIAMAEAAAEAARRARLLERRKTGMLVMNGGGIPSDVKEGKDDPTAVAKSSAASVTATKVDDLSLMILQGKMIEAVLETTINTDLKGSLRAIISRDIYAESGKNILIPRASRLIGSYGGGIKPGDQRLVVTWGRVIRPDGVDIDINSIGTDQLGRSGMTGIVDNKYYELFANSLLVSAITIGSSILVGKVEDTQTQASVSTTTASPDGTTSSSQSGTAVDAAVLQSTQNLGETMSDAIKGFSTQPTIIVNQGARIKVFVNKDLVFPASVVNKRKINN